MNTFGRDHRALSSPVVIFVHIPKTAGTTLHTTLSFQYGHRNSFWVARQTGLDEAEERLKSLPCEVRGKIKLIRGHIPFGWHEHLTQPYKYTTFLRDPFDRLLSLYYYALRATGTYWNELATAAGTFENFVTSGVTTMTDNDQVRQISGSHPPFGHCTEDTLFRAKENIANHFAIVGLTHRFDESLVLLSHELAWRKPLFYLRGMVDQRRAQRAEINKATQELIVQLNRWDLALIEWAEKRLNSQIASNLADVQNGLSRLRRNNRIAGKTLPPLMLMYRSLRNRLSR